MFTITPDQRRFLRAAAHHLKPVVMISEAGLSPAVLKELARTMGHHELIKVKVFSDDRKERASLLQQMCEQLEAAPVQHIGKILVIYKPAEKPVIQLP